MFRSSFILAAGLAGGVLATPVRATVFASNYVPSLTSGLVSGLNDPTAALGPPRGVNGVALGFPNVLDPFNPAFEEQDIVELGPGGVLTLQFPNFVKVGGGLEVGVVSNNLLQDASFPSGVNSNPAVVFGSNTPGGGQAEVLVSNDGVNFHSIGVQTFAEPANFYQDVASPYQSTPGNVPADFGIPFTHPISDFNGLNFAQTIALFGPSGGGTWLNLASSGLSQIDYIQFKVPAGSSEFVVDSVAINNADVGAAMPEPAGLSIILAGGLLFLRRRSH
ncbi:MAG TPA: hypothetical protein VK797_01810 [Tepidisphaeraceae bacterium]|nr:hypothetical protein [Tepidisphaeraceae bacterium]